MRDFPDFAKSIFFFNGPSLKSEVLNLVVETLCHYASCAEIEAFEIFWSFLRKNLHVENLKLSLLKADVSRNNAFIEACF